MLARMGTNLNGCREISTHQAIFDIESGTEREVLKPLVCQYLRCRMEYDDINLRLKLFRRQVLKSPLRDNQQGS